MTGVRHANKQPSRSCSRWWLKTAFPFRLFRVLPIDIFYDACFREGEQQRAIFLTLVCQDCTCRFSKNDGCWSLHCQQFSRQPATTGTSIIRTATVGRCRFKPPLIMYSFNEVYAQSYSDFLYWTKDNRCEHKMLACKHPKTQPSEYKSIFSSEEQQPAYLLKWLKKGQTVICTWQQEDWT